jgi:Fe-S cluster biosynthesis and repair protein YggX
MPELKTKTLMCACSGREEPAITARVPFREPLKSEILERVGAHSWDAWLEQQIKIINEYRLNLATPEARDVLERAARTFLKLDDTGGAAVPAVGPETARELGNLPEGR